MIIVLFNNFSDKMNLFDIKYGIARAVKKMTNPTNISKLFIKTPNMQIVK